MGLQSFTDLSLSESDRHCECRLSTLPVSEKTLSAEAEMLGTRLMACPACQWITIHWDTARRVVTPLSYFPKRHLHLHHYVPGRWVIHPLQTNAHRKATGINRHRECKMAQVTTDFKFKLAQLKNWRRSDPPSPPGYLDNRLLPFKFPVILSC